MDAIIKNVIYLSPPVGLAIVGAYCLELSSTASQFQSTYFFTGIAIIFASFFLAKYGFDSLERMTKHKNKTKLKVEKEKTRGFEKRHQIEQERSNRLANQREAEKEKFGQTVTKDIIRRL